MELRYFFFLWEGGLEEAKILEAPVFYPLPLLFAGGVALAKNDADQPFLRSSLMDWGRASPCPPFRSLAETRQTPRLTLDSGARRFLSADGHKKSDAAAVFFPFYSFSRALREFRDVMLPSLLFGGLMSGRASRC